MKPQFRPTTPDDAPALAAFCERLLSVPAGSPLFSQENLTWKYWRKGMAAPHAEHNLPARSYVLARGDELLAHIAAVPVTLRVEGVERTLLHPFDWASEPSAIGSGALVLHKLGTLADGVLVVGGSGMTQRMLEPLGYRSAGQVQRLYASPDALPLAPELELQPLERFTALPTRSTSAEPPHLGYTLPELNAWLQCPLAAIEFVEVRKDKALLGRLCLGTTPGQLRLLDFWTTDAGRAEALNLPALARQLAARNPQSVEVVAMSNSDHDLATLRAAGFNGCGEVPMFLLANGDWLPEALQPSFAPLYGDVAFLHQGVPERWGPAD